THTHTHTQTHTHTHTHTHTQGRLVMQRVLLLYHLYCWFLLHQARCTLRVRFKAPIHPPHHPTVPKKRKRPYNTRLQVSWHHSNAGLCVWRGVLEASAEGDGRGSSLD